MVRVIRVITLFRTVGDGLPQFNWVRFVFTEVALTLITLVT